MISHNSNNFIHIQIPIPRAICRVTFLLKIGLAFSIIYLTHYVAIKSLKSSNRSSNNSILVNNGKNSFDAFLGGDDFDQSDVYSVKKRHKNKVKTKFKLDSSEPGAKWDNEGSSDDESELIDRWDDNEIIQDQFDPDNYETDENYDEEEDEDEVEDDYENYERHDPDELPNDYESDKDYVEEVSPEPNTNPTNNFPENNDALVNMDTDLDNIESKTEKQPNTIEEDEFQNLINERKRGVTAKMYLSEDTLVKLKNGSLVSQEEFLSIPDKNSVNYMQKIMKGKLRDIEEAQKSVVPTLMSYKDPTNRG